MFICYAAPSKSSSSSSRDAGQIRRSSLIWRPRSDYRAARPTWRANAFHRLSHRGETRLIRLKSEWVIPTGGGYFFSPPIEAIAEFWSISRNCVAVEKGCRTITQGSSCLAALWALLSSIGGMPTMSYWGAREKPTGFNVIFPGPDRKTAFKGVEIVEIECNDGTTSRVSGQSHSRRQRSQSPRGRAAFSA